MATTCKLIGKVTLGSDAANIEFTSIPGTYTDLLILYSFRGVSAGSVSYSAFMRFNGAANDTNHSARILRGNGSTASSVTETFCQIGYCTADGATANTFGNGEVHIPNYANTSVAKSYSASGVAETNATTAVGGVVAGLWNDTAAITAIKLMVADMNIKSGSTAYLYGITKA